MHPTGGSELAQPRVDERVARPALAPGGERRMIRRARKAAHPALERRVEGVLEEPRELQEKVALRERPLERAQR